MALIIWASLELFPKGHQGKGFSHHLNSCSQSDKPRHRGGCPCRGQRDPAFPELVPGTPCCSVYSSHQAAETLRGWDMPGTQSWWGRWHQDWLTPELVPLPHCQPPPHLISLCCTFSMAPLIFLTLPVVNPLFRPWPVEIFQAHLPFNSRSSFLVLPFVGPHQRLHIPCQVLKQRNTPTIGITPSS